MADEGKPVVLPAEGVEDIDGTFTGSEFLEYVGFKLLVSGSSSQKRFLVFSNEDEEEEEIDSTSIRSRSPRPRIDNRMIIGNQIRRALEHVDLANSVSILAQLWVPAVTIGGRRYLQTFSQPFGLTYLAKGLCFYRKLSCSYLQCCTLKSADGDGDDGRQSRLIIKGPPSRVFINGMPEYSPDVGFYSEKEYPLRDVALHRKVKTYMAVPVFGPISQQCLGVLELVSTHSQSQRAKEEMNKPAYMFGLMSTALQGVGLRTSAFACYLDMEKHSVRSSTGQSGALDNIRMALEEACMMHNLPFAQTWTPMEQTTCTSYVLSTTSDEYYQSQLEYSIFRDTCESFHLMVGEGVVWKAFGSGGSCFCRDIGQLNIADYSFSHVAKKARLTTSFATCLKSHHDTGDSGVYVLELFLPHDTKNPQQLLELVLLTLKNHLDGFRIESGKKLGSEMNVEVLKVSENDKVEFFRLFPSSASGSITLLDQDSLIHGEPTLDRQREFDIFIDNAETATQESMESLNCERFLARDTSVSTSLSIGWREEHFSDTRSVKEPGSSYNNSSVSTSPFPDKDYMVDDQDAIGWIVRDADVFETKKAKSSALDWQQQISRQTIEKHFGLKLKEAASSLQVSPATLKRKCRKLGIACWPRKKSNVNSLSASMDSDKENEISRRKYEDNGFQAIAYTEKDATSSKLLSSQASALPMSNFVIIKAQYGAYTIIKFKLPFSSPLLHMEMEVASRLKLEMGDFKIWYQDEDDDYVLLTCDADLRTMESMGKSTVKVCITRGDSAPK